MSLREELIGTIVILAVAALVMWVCLRRWMTEVSVFDFQKGLLYRNGRFEKVLEAGRYRFFGKASHVDIYDMRDIIVTLPGQDILTRDKINLKLSLTGKYRIADPRKAKESAQYYTSDFYDSVQMLLRDEVAALSMEEMLERKAEIDERLFAAAKDKADALGLTLVSLGIRDVILPANLKRAFAGVLEARKEAEKQLEKARGEQAVLRSLANSSKMYDSNPSLLQARIVQALEDGRNTIVFNADGRITISDQPRP